MEYRNLKNFHWITDKIGNDQRSHHKLERPCTRGGEFRGLDFSFVERQDTYKDLESDGSYFERPVTRSKPRRPVSRQVRLNKRVNNLRDVQLDSESFRGDIGECDPPSTKQKVHTHKIEKVIPKANSNNRSFLLSRKRSLRDSTSLDPNLKVNKSINFMRKHSNEPARKTSYKKGGVNSHLILSELNRSIESIKIK